MTDCVRSKLSRIVTQINDNEFLVEGSADFAKFGFQVDETNLNFADIQGGPFLHIGHDFFGKGLIKYIHKLHSDSDGYFILKITIRENNEPTS